MANLKYTEANAKNPDRAVKGTDQIGLVDTSETGEDQMQGCTASQLQTYFDGGTPILTVGPNSEFATILDAKTWRDANLAPISLGTFTMDGDIVYGAISIVGGTNELGANIGNLVQYVSPDANNGGLVLATVNTATSVIEIPNGLTQVVSSQSIELFQIQPAIFLLEPGVHIVAAPGIGISSGTTIRGQGVGLTVIDGENVTNDAIFTSNCTGSVGHIYEDFSFIGSQLIADASGPSDSNMVVEINRVEGNKPIWWVQSAAGGAFVRQFRTAEKVSTDPMLLSSARLSIYDNCDFCQFTPGSLVPLSPPNIFINQNTPIGLGYRSEMYVQNCQFIAVLEDTTTTIPAEFQFMDINCSSTANQYNIHIQNNRLLLSVMASGKTISELALVHTTGIGSSISPVVLFTDNTVEVSDEGSMTYTTTLINKQDNVNIPVNTGRNTVIIGPAWAATGTTPIDDF